MIEKKSYLYSNGAREIVVTKDHNIPAKLWKKLRINEWTFTCLLFVMSLSIVLGKLYINYGNIFHLSYISDVSQSTIKQLSTVNEKFVNISQYDDVLNVMTTFVKTYGWLIRAAICGFIMMGFTWFIIYKDSSIPGINPPSPFSPFNKRSPKTSGVQMNYLIGVLNGILIFVYMCL